MAIWPFLADWLPAVMKITEMLSARAFTGIRIAKRTIELLLQPLCSNSLLLLFFFFDMVYLFSLLTAPI
jgi:hypothetical protein